MKKLLIISCAISFIACNNASESKEPRQDTSASSSADSILKAVEKMKADSAAMHKDTVEKAGDSLKK